MCCADGIIMGSPTYYGQMSGKLKDFIDGSVKMHGKLEGKVGAAFTSSAGTATGAETTLRYSARVGARTTNPLVDWIAMQGAIWKP